jgi:hypothetical protein
MEEEELPYSQVIFDDDDEDDGDGCDDGDDDGAFKCRM